MTEIASLSALFLVRETARNHTVRSQESKEPVSQVAACFWLGKLESHVQNERGHCHGGAENFLLPTCLAAFFALHREGDVEAPGSVLC